MDVKESLRLCFCKAKDVKDEENLGSLTNACLVNITTPAECTAASLIFSTAWEMRQSQIELTLVGIHSINLKTCEKLSF